MSPTVDESKESLRPTYKDILIILGLIVYAWFAYDENDDNYPPVVKPYTSIHQSKTP